MYNITEFKTEQNVDQQFIRSYLATYKYKGIEKSWEIVESMDSVVIFIYKKDTDEFIFVRQFRAPIYYKNNVGDSIELCAGLVDKNMSLIDIAREEVLEECGYDVSVDRIEDVISFSNSPGRSGAIGNFYYVEVTDEDKVSDGGGIHDEDIEVLYVKRDKYEDFVKDLRYPISSGMGYMYLWFKNFKEA